jgi:hypothetical protein
MWLHSSYDLVTELWQDNGNGDGFSPLGSGPLRDLTIRMGSDNGPHAVLMVYSGEDHIGTLLGPRLELFLERALMKVRIPHEPIRPAAESKRAPVISIISGRTASS